MTQPHIRLWNSGLRLMYDSDTDARTVAEFMADQHAESEIYFSKDFSNGDWRNRRSGRVFKGEDGGVEYLDTNDYLQYMLVPPNPALIQPNPDLGPNFARWYR